MLTNITLTDPQGVTHEDAIVLVRHAQHTVNNFEEFYRDPNDILKTIPTERVNSFINCSFYYWVSQEKLSEGREPYTLANTKNKQLSFDFNAADPVYDGMTLEEKCEHYFTEQVLPTLV